MLRDALNCFVKIILLSDKRNRLNHSQIELFHRLILEHNARFSVKNIQEYVFWSDPFRRTKYDHLKKWLKFSPSLSTSTAIATWGLGRKAVKLLLTAVIFNKPFFLFEDGFIRSLYPWVAKVDPRLNAGISFCIDSKGFYYDGEVSTDLEGRLNTQVVSNDDCLQARKIIQKIVDNKISKYNHQPLTFNYPKEPNKKRVLVVDQSYGDMSLICGGVDDSVFERMVQDAVRENPDSEIIFKVHPDTLTKKEASGFIQFIPKEVKIIQEPVNPITLLETVDEVYVATSQLGFEALMCGKKVHVYGLPFYSGWGLTDDKVQCSRRKRKLTLEEMFYIVYMSYSHYVNPLTGQESTIDEAIDYILECRNKLFCAKQ